jgi:competence protein ComEA
MARVTKLESKLGLTRGDVTVTLVLAATALGGFLYTTFVEDRGAMPAHRELMLLMRRHDSVVAAYRAERMAEVRRLLAVADTAAPWQPTTQADVTAEELVDAVERPAGTTPGKGAPTAPVDLNSAPKPELMKLPGVGEKTADAIIDRRRHVPFRNVEEIMDVKGIGEKKFAKMKPFIVVR